MKVFISCDIEGISGVVSRNQTSSDGKDYNRARELMTMEVNAVCRGALKAGAPEILINDSHGSMRNLLIEKIHPNVRLITGSPKPLSMMQGIDNTFDAAMFVGYHSRMGTDGILSHTYSGNVVANIWVNDILAGETGINAGIAGYFGVPVVLVTGDDVVSREAKEILPHVHTATVKYAVNRYAAQCLPVEKAAELLERTAYEALLDLSSARKWKVGSPVTFKIQFRDAGQASAASLMPYAKAIDPVTLSFTADDYLTAFKGLRAMIKLAS